MTKEDLNQLAFEGHIKSYGHYAHFEVSDMVEARKEGFKKALELVLKKCDDNWYAQTANDLRNMLYHELELK